MDYLKLKDNKGIKYFSIDEKWKNFNATPENISDLERNIKQYSSAVKREIYKAISKSGW